MCVCEVCAAQLQNCPICRFEISLFFPVFEAKNIEILFSFPDVLFQKMSKLIPQILKNLFIYFCNKRIDARNFNWIEIFFSQIFFLHVAIVKL